MEEDNGKEAGRPTAQSSKGQRGSMLGGYCGATEDPGGDLVRQLHSTTIQHDNSS